jgi:phosphoenolpyruvate mutase
MNQPVHVTPGQRLGALKRAIADNGFARIMEAHSGLSGIIGERAQVVVDGETLEFDGLWESSLTDSATKGLPDASIIGNESRLHTIDEILHVTSKPMIVDGDTGGEIPQFEYFVQHLERKGVSAVIIEDKVFPKRNSLDAAASQALDDPVKFAGKITAGKRVALTEDFMIIARLESLIAGTGLADARHRAELYIDAGTDGIMIHSNRRDPDDLFEFVSGYDAMCERMGRRPLLVAVPTTYNQHSDRELASLGFDIIIHANQQLRSSHRAMNGVVQSILETGSSWQADELSTSTKEIFSLVGHDRITATDRERSEALRLPVIIPAAGRDEVFSEGPKSLIPVAGKPILEHQLESIRKAGLKRTVIVRGHEGGQFDAYATDENLSFSDNPRYLETHSLSSLMAAAEHMDQGFVVIVSDILFEHEILSRLVRSGKDIVLAIDNSYTYHKHYIDKKLDMVVSRKSFDSQLRSLRRESMTELVRIGKNIDTDLADYEFIGMAYFSEEGARALRTVYDKLLGASDGPFHEAASFAHADITDMLQELINRGYLVHSVEATKGWREIHSRQDIEVAEAEMAAMPQGV